MGTKSLASATLVKEPLKCSEGVRKQTRTPATTVGKKGAGRRVKGANYPFLGNIQHSPLGVYVVLAFFFSWGAWIPLLSHRITFASKLWKLTYIAGLSGPLLAALLVSFAMGGRAAAETLLKRGLIWKLKARWYLVALALPPLLMMGGWYMAAAVGQRHPQWEMPSLSLLPMTFVIMALRGGPLNEEFGWRGFLLPKLLERFSPFNASLILAPVWTLWHLPLWFLPGVPHKYWPFGLFALLVVPITFLFTWLYCRGKGSVLISILFHASFNTAIHYLPLLPPRHSSLVPFEMWVGLTWVLTALIVVSNSKVWFSQPVSKPKALLKASTPSLVYHR
jgi:membrane protease YdiL (CAAX protease family)